MLRVDTKTGLIAHVNRILNVFYQVFLNIDMSTCHLLTSQANKMNEVSKTNKDRNITSTTKSEKHLKTSLSFEA